MSRKSREAKQERRNARRRLAPVGRREPTREDATESAVRFMQIADEANTSRVRSAKLLEEYFGHDTDELVKSVRLWGFASIGPILVGAAIQKLNRGVLKPDDLWAIEKISDAPDDPDALAAAQTVVRYLNDDQETMHALISAHFEAAFERAGYDAAHEALLGLVMHHLVMLARLIDAGAFETSEETQDA